MSLFLEEVGLVPLHLELCYLVVMRHDPYALYIHIDGSAFNNPGGEGGIAAIVEYPLSLNRDPETIFAIGYTATTNNRMELSACIKALEWARMNAPLLKPPRIVIITDSTYVYEHHNHAGKSRFGKWDLGGKLIELIEGKKK